MGYGKREKNMKSAKTEVYVSVILAESGTR